jgi:hypothetical protein
MGADANQLRSPGDWAVLQTTSTDQVDRLTVDVPTLPAGATITNIIACAIAKVGTGSGNLRVGLRGSSAGEVYNGADVALTAGYKLVQYTAPVDPGDNSAWTTGDLSSVRLLIKSR